MEFKIKNTKIIVQHGDILQLPVDAIVCPATSDLWMAKGLAAEIVKRGGQAIADEAKSKSHSGFGDIVVTGAGTLPYKNILHAVLIPRREEQIERRCFNKAVKNALVYAENNNFKSIGFPMLGSAMAKVPYDMYAGLILRGAFEYFLQGSDSKLESVVFCLFDKDAYSSFAAQVNVLRQEFFI